jgi:hypothetical protein
MHVALKLPKKLQVDFLNQFIERSQISVSSVPMIVVIRWAESMGRKNCKQQLI